MNCVVVVVPDPAVVLPRSSPPWKNSALLSRSESSWLHDTVPKLPVLDPVRPPVTTPDDETSLRASSSIVRENVSRVKASNPVNDRRRTR